MVDDYESLLARWRVEKDLRARLEEDCTRLLDIVLACPRCAATWAEECMK